MNNQSRLSDVCSAEQTLTMFSEICDFMCNDEKTEEDFDRIVADIIERKAWQDILFFSLCGYGWCSKAFIKCMNLIPKDERWRLLLTVYSRDGYDFPKEIILDSMSYRPCDYLSCIPQEYDTETIKVYRASTTPYKNRGRLLDELSWTVSPKVARDFYQMRLSRGEKCYIYSAEIKKKDIIACMSFGIDGQKEILQYHSIHNLSFLSQRELDIACSIEELGERLRRK